MDLANNPMAHFNLDGGDLTEKVSGQSILADIGSSVKAYREGEYESFGRQMGTLIELLSGEQKLSVPESSINLY